jgi:hypothetical protein
MEKETRTTTTTTSNKPVEGSNTEYTRDLSGNTEGTAQETK